MKMVTNANKVKVAEKLAAKVIDEMDQNDLIAYAIDQMEKYFTTFNAAELHNEIMDYYGEDGINELVD